MAGRTWLAAPVTGLVAIASSPAMAQSTDSAELSAEVKALRDEVAALKAEIEAIKAERDAPTRVANVPPPSSPVLVASSPSPAPAPTPSAPSASPPPVQITFKGAPEFKSDNGWSFKPRGRFQFDAGYFNANSVAESILGGPRYAASLRRAYVGAQGTIPGGFTYRAEIDLAPKTPEWADVYLTYGKGPVTVTVGQIYPYLGIEEQTSDLFTSFTERASFTSAFNYRRRVGVAVDYTGKWLMVGGGVFADGLNELLPDGAKSFGVDGRAVLMPTIGSTQLHLAGSLHFRHYYQYPGENVIRYRMRPYYFATPVRPIETDNVQVREEALYGLEAGAIRGRLHVVGEAAWLRSTQINDYSPTYFGDYAEIGFFLTPDTRAYHNGVFDRVVPKHPVGGGGIGAVEWNLRYDYLDITDRSSIFAGREWSVGTSMIWTPNQYLRFMANYVHMRLLYRGFPADSGIDTATVRAQVDF